MVLAHVEHVSNHCWLELFGVKIPENLEHLTGWGVQVCLGRQPAPGAKEETPDGQDHAMPIGERGP